MTGLLLKYNKVHNDSLMNLSSRLNKIAKLLWGDLTDFGADIDLLSFAKVDKYIDSFGDLDFIVIGDVFWPTGQSICGVCKERNISVFFMQHGQWIYIVNKKVLNHYPTHTILFGDDVGNMCSSWEYAKFSKIAVMGNSRYDHASPNGVGSYAYFSPPVIEELMHDKPSGKIRLPYLKALERIVGIDKEVPMVIQPHYREARTSYLHKMFPKAQFADPTMDALQLIRGSVKVLTTRNSTVVLDAIAHQKMVVLMDSSTEDVSFFERGYFGDFALESDGKKHLLQNLISLNSKKFPNYMERAKKYIYLGDASSRIAELIKQEV